MDRRQFVSFAGLAAAAGTPAVAEAEPGPPTQKGQARAPEDAGLFRTVNLQSDGLALDPREYTALLGRLAVDHPPSADNYSNGGAIEELERQFARMLGKPAAIFLPTGTLANHIAVRKLAGTDRRVLVQAESHLYNDSGDCAQTLSGLNLIPLGRGQASFDLEEVKSWVERSAGGRVETRVGVIVMESPVRRRDHAMFDPQEMRKISEYARATGIRLHLDGARMFTLPYHSGRSLREHAALFDTVYVSLWKHFDGAAGAILAGSADFIDGLFHVRRMFGASLPQAWPLTALVLQSAEQFESNYERAWKSAQALLDLFATDSRFGVRRVVNGTSRLFLTVRGDPVKLSERLLQKGVVLSHPQSDTGEIPVQINLTLLRTSADALFKAFVTSV